MVISCPFHFVIMIIIIIIKIPIKFLTKITLSLFLHFTPPTMNTNKFSATNKSKGEEGDFGYNMTGNQSKQGFNQTGQSFGANPASLKGKLMSLEVFFALFHLFRLVPLHHSSAPNFPAKCAGAEQKKKKNTTLLLCKIPAGSDKGNCR